MKPNKCKLCESKVLAKGYCVKHYWKIKRAANPKQPKPKPEIKICKLCEKRAVGRGYCSTHYKKMLRMFPVELKNNQL